LSIEEITPDSLLHWDSASFETARMFDDRWYDQRRTSVPMVPSVATRVERNILINQEHRSRPHPRGRAVAGAAWIPN